MYGNQKKNRYLECSNCRTFSIDPFLEWDNYKNTEVMTKMSYLHSVKVQQQLTQNFQEFAYKDFLEEIRKYRKNGNILDIGCGIGSFLIASKAIGWKEYGVEIGSSAQIAKDLGVNVVQKNFLETNFQYNFFDVITSIDVLEHISNPKLFLEMARNYLRPEGLLYIITPNIEGMSSRILKEKWLAYAQVDHVILYSPKTIKYLLEKCGFKIKKIKTMDLFVSEYFLSKRVEDYNETRDKEQINKRKFINALMKYKTLNKFRKLVNSLLSKFGLGDRIIVYATKSEC